MGQLSPYPVEREGRDQTHHAIWNGRGDQREPVVLGHGVVREGIDPPGNALALPRLYHSGEDLTMDPRCHDLAGREGSSFPREFQNSFYGVDLSLVSNPRHLSMYVEDLPHQLRLKGP